MIHSHLAEKKNMFPTFQHFGEGQPQGDWYMQKCHSQSPFLVPSHPAVRITGDLHCVTHFASGDSKHIRFQMGGVTNQEDDKRDYKIWDLYIYIIII